MNKYKILILSLLLSTTFCIVKGQQTKEITNANDVLEKSIAAMGGKEALSNVKTLYTEMSTEMDGRKVLWITKEMAPNMGAFQIVYNNRVVFENWFDGKNGYEIVRGEKKKADPEEFKAKKYKKHIMNELDYIDPTLWTLTLSNETPDVNGEPCYKVEGVSAGKETRHFYFSKKSFFVLREDLVSNKEAGKFSSTYFSHFKKFGDLVYYTRSKSVDENKTQEIEILNLWVNEKITEKDFKR